MIAPFGLRPKATLAQRALPLARTLQKHGMAVRIVAPAYLNPADAGTTEIIDGVEVVHVRLPRTPDPFAYVETSFALVQATLAWRPALVHVFKPKGYSGLAALWLRLFRPGLPLVQDTDDWEGWGGWNDLGSYSPLQKHFFAWQEKTLPRQADAVTVASRTLETQVWGFGVPPARVHYVPNGVSDVPVLPPREVARRELGLNAAPVVLLYTRFWEYPLRVLLEFLVGLRVQAPTARLLVLGAGERNEEQGLARWAERVGVRSQLDLRGWSSPSTIHLGLAAADVAIVPFADTLMNRAKCSVKLLELLNAGVPVVASRVGQVTEYIRDPFTGLLVSPEDGGALAQGALRLLSDVEERQALGRAGQRYVQSRFRWDQLGTKLHDLYCHLLASGHA